MRAPLCSADPVEALSRAVIDDPAPFYARLRDEAPLSRVGDTGVHLAATWELIEEALGREADFSANLTGVLCRGDDGRPTVFELPSSAATEVIATADEPAHTVQRNLAQPRFAARYIEPVEADVRAWVREELAPLVADGGGEFVRLVEVVPARVVADLLGLPQADVERVRAWAMIGGDMLAGEVDAAGLGRLASATSEMSAYLGEKIALAAEAPRGSPGAPLLHHLARGVASGDVVFEAATGIAIVLFGAGGESTAALLASCLRRLAEHPDIADELRRDRGLVGRFVEEVVRLDPPFKFHYRPVRRDCELGGFELRRGDRLMLLWASANRDAAVFDDPGRLAPRSSPSEAALELRARSALLNRRPARAPRSAG